VIDLSGEPESLYPGPIQHSSSPHNQRVVRLPDAPRQHHSPPRHHESHSRYGQREVVDFPDSPRQHQPRPRQHESHSRHGRQVKQEMTDLPTVPPLTQQQGPLRTQSTPRHRSHRSSHPQIDSDYRHGRPLQRSHYSQFDFPNVFKDLCRVPLTSRLSRQNLATLNAPVQFSDHEEFKKLYTRWSEVFNQGFFFNALLDRIAPIQYVRRGDCTTGYYEHTGAGLVIDPNHPLATEYPGTRAQLIISTLAHEMLHAFLDVYRCRCLKCLSRNAASRGGVGSNGHGPAWAACMRTIEIALQDAVQFRIDTNIWGSLQLSMKTDGWGATPNEMAKWTSPDLPHGLTTVSTNDYFGPEEDHFHGALFDDDSDISYDSDSTFTLLRRPRQAHPHGNQESGLRPYNSPYMRVPQLRARPQEKHKPIQQIRGRQVPSEWFCGPYEVAGREMMCSVM
jgi:hypothetical protein